MRDFSYKPGVPENLSETSDLSFRNPRKQALRELFGEIRPMLKRSEELDRRIEEILTELDEDF